MYFYDKENNELVEVEETTYSENNLKERENIEEWIRKNPSILDEELLIISHEYDKFEIRERLDLLAIDKEGSLVILELKKDESGSNVDFQALKYCSYCSTLKPAEIIEIYQEYIEKFKLNINSEESLMNHLEIESLDLLNNILNNQQKIILASSNFDKRILSVSAWLANNNIDIRCFSVKPYIKNDELIVDIELLIPPKNINDYVIKKSENNNLQGKISQPIEIVQFFENIVINASKSKLKVLYYDQKTYCHLKIPKKKINIGLVIKKNIPNFTIEIVAKGEVEKQYLFDVYEKKKMLIEEKLGIEFSIESNGKFNPNWGRLLYSLPLDRSLALEKYVESIGNLYINISIIFKELLV
ncbi:hypothetical protein [Leptospira levettii]|uniref:hypothetical protein n=1 Tax=Leptospira levettii TaxID=2023178 RepID=UPI000C2AD1C6|nr:hypothetical protein [Leptospira levettii]PKA22718.1 hypothetical protein CH381_29475 [Leptospira sp. mixed culture ATI2-C-A1]TGM23495.1 hypothetical protein EHQ74_18015 [Leptospira levettii]